MPPPRRRAIRSCRWCRRLRAAVGEPTAQWVHFGATSQDVVDTALMLLVVRAGEPLVQCVRAAADSCAELADRHRDTVTVARTLGQQAVPTTFGLKAATWLSGLDAAGHRLRRRASPDGPPSSLVARPERSPRTEPRARRSLSAFARNLGLCEPALPWHTDRQRVLEIADAVAAIGPAAAKVATDVITMASSEVGELREGGVQSWRIIGDAEQGKSGALRVDPRRRLAAARPASPRCTTRPFTRTSGPPAHGTPSGSRCAA